MISNDELSVQAYKQIRNMIISKKLKAGQKIVQDKLAESLGISRTPLRSALQMLEAEYLVESIPRKGVIVKEFTNEEIVEIYDCRIALEVTAITLFSEKATKADIESLAKLFAPFQKDPSQINPTTYKLADIKFHESIINKCGNGFLKRLFLQGNLLVCIDLIGLIRPPAETLKEHMAIIEAIRSGDKKLAASLAKSHLDVSKQLVINKIDND